MISADNVFLCAGLRAAVAYREVLRRAGLQLEVQQFVSARQFALAWRTEVDRLKLVKRSLGLRYAFHAPFLHLNFFSRSQERAAASWEALVRSLDIAAELEAEFVVVHSLFIPRRRNPDYGADWPQVAPEFFRRIAREAASRGLAVAVENMLETEPSSMLWLLRETDYDKACVCLDVAHTAVAGGGPPAEWVRRLGPALRHMHLSDNHGFHDDHLALGDGTVDIAGAVSAAADLPQPVSLGIECRLRDAENVLKSLEYLSNFPQLSALRAPSR